MAVALVVGVVVLAVVLGVLLVPRLFGRDDVATPDPAPSPTVSAWDETSRPTPTPTPSQSPSPTPTPTPSGSATAAPLEDCPLGDPGTRQEHPEDGLVHGGGLAYEPVPGWDDYSAYGYSWTYDAAGQVDHVVDSWIASTVVGALAIADGFETPESAAADFLACTTTSAFYRNLTGITELRNEAITVDGRPGWWIRAEIRVSGEQVEGDVSDVIVVDDGDGESLSFYTSCAPIGDTERIALIDAARESLRVG
ncbi:hypothetical protein [Desertihabitans brevis]|uniref:hypothetical protein n=1 Tax=Desertihabitans brevis TaxID=2268447 RepID=UPI0011BF9576|nr:hypothetical protein [Desertihabitans brevis]